MIRNPLMILMVAVGIQAMTAFGQHVPQSTYAPASGAPEWVVMMYSGGYGIEEVRSAFEEYYRGHAFEKNRDTQFYKRWLRNSEIPAPEVSSEYRLRHHEASQRMTGIWEELGPWSYDPDVAMEFQVQSPGACHVYTVEQALSNHEVVWCGTATAGAWKSEDHGQTWSLMTRDLPLTSVYSIAIHPQDASFVYVGSGSGQLWKTLDGGLSWEMCGNSIYQGANRWYRDLVFAPADTAGLHSLFAATNYGMFRTSDEGETMQQVMSGEYMELVFHPTVDSIAYTVQLLGESTVFKRSTDGGLSFQTGATGWPSINSGDQQKRCEIAVSPADPDRIAVLAAGSTSEGGGLYGIYQSQDAGQTFDFICCGNGPGGPWAANDNPNILGWSEDGTGDGGQYYYDLALDISPTDADRQFAAGICVWRSEDGGSNWALNGHWVTWAGEFTHDRYTHADVHDVKFFTRTDGTVDMWVASDGGLYYSADQGDHMEPRMYGLHGTDFWGWQSGWRGPEVMVGGTYHNGTMIRNADLYHWGADDDSSGGWLAELAGDNFRGFINPGDATRGYHDGGAFRFTSDRFDRIDPMPFDGSKKPNTAYWFGEYGNLEWDPTCYNCMYSPVGSELWKSIDGGASWELVHDFGGEKIISVKVSPRDPNRIYVSHKQSGSAWRIHRTSDGGENWELASPSTAENGFNNNQPIYLDVDGTNPDRLWCILTGNQSGYKILHSDDAGESWQNLTTSAIASERVVSLAHQRGTEGGIYLGTTKAVYFKDDTMDDWLLYNTGLPMINVCTFLQPDYCGGHIRTAGTRGVHQADFHHPSDVLSGFMADRTEINLATPCTVAPIHFSSVAVARCESTDYAWQFPGASSFAVEGAEAWALYDEAGSYDVSLTVTDSAGNSDSWTWEGMIQAIDEPVVSASGFSEDFDGPMFPPAHWRMEIEGHAWEHAWDLNDASNGVAQFPNYWVNTDGAYDLLITPAFDPTGMTAFQFDVAHQTYADYVDGLEVWGRTGDNEEWTMLWSAYGAELAVPGCYTWFWYDTNGSIQWATHSVLFPNDWVNGGETCLELAFVNVGGYGNHTWIDNVSINGINSSGQPLRGKEMAIFPNPNGGEFRVTFPTEWMGLKYTVCDAWGREIHEGRVVSEAQAFVVDWPSGVYLTQVEGQPVVRWIIQ